MKDSIARIEKSVKQGDFTLAHDFLMTGKLNGFPDGFEKHHRCCESIDYQVIVFYFVVVVNTLPQIGGTDVIDLLCKYYYGEKSERVEMLSNRSVESMVTQLMLGSYVDPKHRKINGKIKVANDFEQVGSNSNVFYTVTYENKSEMYIWLFQFQKYLVHGKQVWIPVRWGSGGNRD